MFSSIKLRSSDYYKYAMIAFAYESWSGFVKNSLQPWTSQQEAKNVIQSEDCFGCFFHIPESIVVK